MAMECVGRGQTVRWAAESIRPEGRVAVVGLGPDEVRLMHITEFVRGEVMLLGSSAFEMKEIKDILMLIASGRLDLTASISKTIALDEVNEALNELSERQGDVIRTVVTGF